MILRNFKIILTLVFGLIIISNNSFAEKAGKKNGGNKSEKNKSEKQGKKAAKSDKKEKPDKQEKAEKDDSGVKFSNLKNDQKVKSPLKVKMHVSGMKVMPAGDPTADSGHFHIIIDGDIVEKGKIIPADDKHLHYGLGQTEVELKLSPGKHKLILQFADKDHISLGKKWSDTVKVLVE